MYRWRDRGRNERFCSPASPSLRHRDGHLRAVRSLTPKPAATSPTGRPSPAIRRIISARPSGVVRAFLCGLFILVPCGASCRNDHLLALTGDEQPPQTPHLGAAKGRLPDSVAPFDRARWNHHTERRLIKPNHPQINGQVMQMDRSPKDAAVR